MAAIRSLEVANSGNGVATIGGGRGRAAAGAGIATRTTRGAAAGGAASSHEHVAGVFDGVSTSALFSCMAAVALLQVGASCALCLNFELCAVYLFCFWTELAPVPYVDRTFLKRVILPSCALLSRCFDQLCFSSLSYPSLKVSLPIYFPSFGLFLSSQ